MILRKQLRAGFIIIFAVALIVAASRMNYKFKEDSAEASTPESFSSSNRKEAALPADESFRQVAETDILRLKLDESTGHFQVEDKRNGHVWRSYPDPRDWANESIGGMWKQHLVSPLMFQYIDFTVYNSPPKESNFTAVNGTINAVKEIEGGVQWTYDMPEYGLSVPVQIRILDDYVETKIIDGGIKEHGYSLLWLRLFPFLAAEHSANREGYMFIPDGSGALIRFDDNRISTNRGYQEPVFGRDPSFETGLSFSSRYPVKMPVFGIKSGNKAMLAVIGEGAEYSEVFAAPSGLFSQYNWITAQQKYRAEYEQITNRNKGTSYITYNKEMRFGTDRTVRYYFLDEDEADYAGMAARYRRYLMQEKGMRKLEDNNEPLPLYISLIGGDTADGMIGDRYIQATSTEEAGLIVTELRNRGVGKMYVTYMGWQKGGYSAHGGYFPADDRLGGNEGMKRFVELAHSMHAKVLLGVNYDLNNTGANGFMAQYHAVRDMAGTIQKFRHRKDNLYMASQQFILETIEGDLSEYQKFGADGLFLEQAGSMLASDYNARTGSDRTEALKLQEEIFQQVNDSLGIVEAENPNFYAVDNVTHIRNLSDDFSYDLFSEKPVPFAQIALHGLITYTSSEENDRHQNTNDFLRDIEYGALPSFVFTQVETEALTEAHGLQLKSSAFADWAETAAAEYERYNKALAGVQSKFITDHRELANGVMATIYEDGTTILVNYNDNPYVHGQVTVPARNYVVLEGNGGV
ncbi:DUF5696 domain-containing protein [Paenibacillus alkalitolerans]|uniref:DUF5696 domain-containing protein n=1 Tax=Paenibacillus alkalitolerans TaxID=2799335 RepID=UPI0018F57EF9|nr:DUF5696 domain-containing protein [Paenibacillus alkalitolerans]